MKLLIRGVSIAAGHIAEVMMKMIQQYIQEQEGEPMVDDKRFAIDPS